MNVLLTWGACARQVKIMKEWDPSGKQGPKTPLPDIVKVHEPKDSEDVFDDKDVSKVKEVDGFGVGKDMGYQEQQVALA